MSETALLAAEIDALDELTVEDLLLEESTDSRVELRGCWCSWCGC
jgi:hypothetical protein